MGTEGRRTVLVGDVHGCLDELQAVLRKVGADPSADDVILVGDLVAKGPDSRGVVQLCRESGFRAVLGNHDAKVLSLEGSAATRGWPASPWAAASSSSSSSSSSSPGASSGPPWREAGLHETVAASLSVEDWEFLRDLPLFIRLPLHRTIVVHAGLLEGVELDQQPRKYLLNLRSITDDGEPSTRVKDGVPWAARWTGPEHVVFGHDAIRGLQRHLFATGLDTGCVYGRRLTALVLPEHTLVSVPAARVYTPP
jgi:hypothetical protein